MDGSHELASSFRKSAGRIRAAVGFYSAAFNGWTSDEKTEDHEAFRESRGEITGDFAARKGGAGSFRHVSRTRMNAQVWIAMAVGIAAMVDDLARRHIANWIPAAALAGGLGWQIGSDGWHGLLTSLGGTV